MQQRLRQLHAAASHFTSTSENPQVRGPQHIKTKKVGQTTQGTSQAPCAPCDVESAEQHHWARLRQLHAAAGYRSMFHGRDSFYVI